jgi:hypothetical protein
MEKGRRYQPADDDRNDGRGEKQDEKDAEDSPAHGHLSKIRKTARIGSVPSVNCKEVSKQRLE